ncbi:L,D-transpeptidase [Nocardia uniformis]|uniref:L,D-transpeptidase n=1 Tax=Nocardia uniformis TaxID=53432 RepID=A0A849C0Q3_9NOCA|nr:L,D-transpeptidase [Nocardia uniformis]NNH69437.1 L,D-transpeptidase [Nocardia uniformis]
MRNAIRYLFVATVVAALAAFGSGIAAAAIIEPSAPAVQAISPGPGETVGIAAPVRVQFAEPVENRARAEQSVNIRAETALAGTFSWTGDRELTWSPTGFLPASSPISVSVGGARTEFNTNAGVTAEGDMSNYTFTVSIGGVPVRTMPASFGKPGWETPSGTFPVMEKFASITFDSRTIGIPLNDPEGYLIEGQWAERLTWGGVFVHSAPWSVDSQGNANVSHGCINLPPGDAQWYYENVSVGDPVYLHW